ncbi:MAG: PAS domain S-box protein [Verrucomicrobiota bacterium]
MNQKPRAVALRASLLYVAIAGAWVLCSDELLAGIVRDRTLLVDLQLLADWLIVVFSGVMFYFTLRNFLTSKSGNIQELKRAEALTRLQRDTLEGVVRGQPLLETLDRMLRGIEALTPDTIGSILLLTADGKHLSHGAAPSLPEEFNRAIDGVAIGPKVGSCGTAAFRGSPVFVGDIATDPLWSDFKALALPHGLRACWSTPIFDAQNQVLGTFAIYHRRPGLPDESQVGIIEAATQLAATAIIKQKVEQSLRENEQRFRSLVEQASDAIVVYDLNGKLRDVNAQACTSLGYAREEMLQLSVTDIAGGFDWAVVQDISRSLQPNHPRLLQVWHRGKDGSILPVEVSLSCYHRNDEQLVLAVARDISERKKYEAHLAENISLLSTTIESSSSGILVVDLQGRVRIANQRFQEMWRIPAEAARSGDDEAILQLVLEQLSEPQAFVQRVRELYGQPEVDSFETISFLDGRLFERRSRPQRLGDQIIGRVWSFLDVTAERKISAALHASEERYRILFEFSPAGFLREDEAGRIIDVNNAICQLTGYSREELLGCPVAMFAPAPYAGLIEPHREKVLAGGIHVHEVENLTKSGGVILVKIVETCITFPDGHREILCNVTDITEAKRTATQLADSEASYRNFFNVIADAIYVQDEAGKFLAVNDSAVAMYGYAKEEFIGQTPAFLSAPGKNHMASAIEATRRAFAGVPQHFEWWGLRKNGEIFPKEVELVQGTYFGQKVVFATGRDITLRRQAEASLQHERQLLRTLVDLAPDFIFVKDLQSHYLVVNEALAKCYGQSPAAMLGRTDADYLPPDLAAQFRATEQKVMSEPALLSVEDAICLPDGQRRTVLTNMVAFRDAWGQVSGLVGIGRDITALRTAEKSMRLLSTALESAANAVMITDQQGAIEYVNPAFSCITGYSQSDCLGKNPRELVRSDKQDREFYRVLWQTIQAGQVWRGELINRRKDGSLFLEEMTITPLMGPERQITHYVAIKQDISARKKLEETVREAGERTRFYMQRMPLAFIAMDRDFNITEWNVAAENIFGWPALEAVGRNLLALVVPPDKQSQIAGVWQEVIATGNSASHAIHESVTRAGRRIICEWRHTPWRDACGGICGCLSLVEDITEQKLAEEKNAREQARFKLIFDTIPIGIAFRTRHPDGRISRIVNDAHLRITGLRRDQHNQPGIYGEITIPEDRLLQQQFTEQVDAGIINQFFLEKRYRHPDGRLVWVHFSYQRETYPEGTREELITIVDITERKRLEEQLRQSQKMEAIGQLSGGIAHDFNNILTVIMGNAALLQEAAINPAEANECVNQIANAADRAAGLTRQLLMFSRKQQLQTVNLDLSESAAKMTKLLQRILGEHITLRSEYAPALPLIKADPGMIEQIIFNLAVNARDAMPGGGRLTINTSVALIKRDDLSSGGGAEPHVCLSLTDSGSGIPPEILPRIFEPFFTTKEVGKGTGLGLAIVYGIVQQHRGQISVSSEVGVGTTFRIAIPALPSAEKGLPGSLPQTVLVGGSETILLVEDEVPLQVFVRDLLLRYGYRVLVAGSGPAALDLWREHREHIRLVFTDVIMPEKLSGLDLGRLIQADKPSVVVIYTSGYTGGGADHEALVEGVNFIRKPFKPEAVVEMIRRKLDEAVAAE